VSWSENAPVAAEEWIFPPSYKSSLSVAQVHDGYKFLYRRTLGTCHDQRAVGIGVSS